MGKKSRNKTRPRGQAGELYSKYQNEKIIMLAKKNWGNEHFIETVNKAIEKNDKATLRNIALMKVLCFPANLTHIFITSENIIDFISKQSVEIKDLDTALNIVKTWVEKEINVLECEKSFDVNKNEFINNELVAHRKDFYIHFVNRKHSIFVSMQSSEKELSIFYDTSIGEKIKLPNKIYGYEQYQGWINALDKEKVITDEEIYSRQIINTILYMDAFQECVKEGPPPIICETTYKKCTIITESDKLKETYSNGITPHMRRGHFRFLKSDVFKNKRWQTIYISPTMVKGTAKHVVEV